MPASWTDLCALADVPAQGGRYVAIGNHALAVFKLPGGEVRVTDDSCPHAGGSLSAGLVDRASACVICPLHAWTFSLQDGRCPDNPDIAVRTYEARVVNGRVEGRIGNK